jgi:very-short-patch-repair endonuclease
MPRRPTAAKLPFARALRSRMTVAETIMWRALRGSRFEGFKFRRQVPIGKYVADFLCIEHKLIVELDGAPHDDPEQKVHDARRTIWLRSQGYRVLRIPNDTVIGGCDIALARIRATLLAK